MKLQKMTVMRMSGNHLEIGDMLRYDFAFACTEYPDYVVFPQFKTKDGTMGGRITHGRWESFGVKLMPLDKKILDAIADHVLEFPEKWKTRLHPSYSNDELIPMSIGDCLRLEYKKPGDVTRTATEIYKGKPR
jgi:hypothetical protein